MKYKQDKGLYKCLGAISVILGCFFIFILCTKAGVLLFWGDGADQYVQFTTHAYELIKSNDLSFWSHSIGLGANIFTMFFTVLGSPSFYLMLLSPSKEFLVYAILIIDILRFFVVSILTYMWLSKIVRNDIAKIVTTIAFTFSGWMMFWLHFPYFMDMFIYLAALLYLSEEMLDNKKNILFSLVVALLAILSIYQLYMVTWLLFIYLMCRYFMKNKKFDGNHFGQSVLRVFLYYVLGIGIAAVVLIPSISILLSTNRISIENANFFSLIGIKDIFRTITSLISPISNDFDYNIYISSITNGISDGNTAYTFTTILLVLLLPQFYKIKFESKRVFLITFGFLYTMLLFKFSYFLFNGNESIRWSFFIIVFNCIALAYLIENNKQWNLKLLTWTFVLIVFLILTLVFIGRGLNLISPLNREIQKIVVPILLIICSTQFVLIIYKKLHLLVIVAIVEAILCLFIRTYNGNEWIIAEGKEIWYYQSLIYRDSIIDVIREQESTTDFYRIEFNDTTNLGHNLPLSNNYNGFTSYVSVFNYNTYEFLENRFGYQWYFGYQPSKSGIKTILGDRYLVINEGDVAPYEYDKIVASGINNLYMNRYSNSFGYATSKVINKKDITEQPIFVQDFAMMQGIVVDGFPSSFEYNVPNSIKFDSERKVFQPIDAEQGYYYIDYSLDDANATCRFEMYDNSAEFDSVVAYEIGYQALNLKKEYNDIFAYCTSQNNPNHYTKLNIYWVPFSQLEEVYDNFTKTDQFDNTEVQGDYITTTIHITEGQKLTTTNVAYDAGWSVYDNGNKIETYKTNLGFVGFVLDQGFHDIEMRYIPPGFIVGASLSVLSLFLVIVISFKKKVT